MSKLISNPTECGYRDTLHNDCLYGNRNPCKDNKSFPTTCPLQDGISVQHAIKAITAGNLAINAAEDALTIAEKIVKPKRRNRNACVHFLNTIVYSNNCDMSNTMRHIKCTGVNCGYFKTK